MRHADDLPDPNLAAVARRVGVAELEAAPRPDLSVAIVAATWNRGIVDRLVAGAINELSESGIAGARIRVVRVPGAWELPLAARAALDAGADAVVALGCVIRGETFHFEIVSNESARGLMALTLDGLAIGNGILTVETEAQAIARADPAQKNKAGEAVTAALALMALKQRFA